MLTSGSGYSSSTEYSGSIQFPPINNNQQYQYNDDAIFAFWFGMLCIVIIIVCGPMCCRQKKTLYTNGSHSYGSIA